MSGAGPAGAAAAAHAARAGLKVLLLDKSLFPRPKPCAGGVTTAAVAELPAPLPDHLGLDTITKLNANYRSNGKVVFNGDPFMVTVDRRAFDQWIVELAQAAGAFFRPGVRVESAESEGGLRRVSTNRGSFLAPVVIGADGMASRLAGSVRRKFRPVETGLCLVAEVDGPHLAARHQGEIVVDYGAMPRGYGWIFPKGGRVNIGVGAICGRGKELRRGLEELCRRWGVAPVPQALGCWPVPVGGFSRPLAISGLLLAGDAAGFVDPFTGEGIRHALVSGRQAAQAAVAISKGTPECAALTRYKKDCQEMIERDLRAALMISLGFFVMPSLCHRVFFHHTDIFGRLLKVLQGRQSYRQLVAWLALNSPWLAVSSVVRSVIPSPAP
ncbi:MAG: geranylgeranyl reductase family protein [Bacillota bacterium]